MRTSASLNNRTRFGYNSQIEVYGNGTTLFGQACVQNASGVAGLIAQSPRVKIDVRLLGRCCHRVPAGRMPGIHPWHAGKSTAYNLPSRANPAALGESSFFLAKNTSNNRTQHPLLCKTNLRTLLYEPEYII